MSFILDALKKSENQRQRNIGPSLADIPIRRARTERPWWAVAVAALLVVNLGVLVIVLTRRDADSTADAKPVPVQAATAAPQAASVPAANVPKLAPAQGKFAVAGNPAARSLAEEAAGYGEDEYQDAAAGGPNLAAAAAVPDGPPIVRPIDAPAVAPLDSRQNYDARAASAEILPTVSSLAASGTVLPEMKLDIHVYSAKPAERFVFVNMRKYVEGQTLTEGPVIERITPDGVVLNQRGTRFILPRQ